MKSIGAIIVGLVAGSGVNLGLITVGATMIPAPTGVDVSDPASIAQSMHLFEARHFVFPFLAHAGGTFIGALCAGFIEANRRRLVTLTVGALFFAGGIAASTMIPAPTAFVVIDLLGAYFPMALAAMWLLNKTAQASSDASRD